MKKEKKYNGKPMSHWQQMAKENVIDYLVRGSIQYADKNCLPRDLASKELMSLAISINRMLVSKILEERGKFEEGMAMALASILLPDKNYYAKSRRRSKKAPRKKA